MKAKFLTSLAATTAAIATAFIGGAAEASNLKSSDPAFYDFLVSDYLLATPESQALPDYEKFMLTGDIVALDDDVEVFLVDVDPFAQARALFDNTLTYTVNGGATQDLFDGDRVDDYIVKTTGVREVELGEGDVLIDPVTTNGVVIGDILDFKLVSKPIPNRTNIFGADIPLNPDNLQHIVAYELQHDGYNWVYLGWEDNFGGGDFDFNDAAIVIKNAKITPEPGVTLALLGAVAGAMGLRRRKDAA